MKYRYIGETNYTLIKNKIYDIKVEKSGIKNVMEITDDSITADEISMNWLSKNIILLEDERNEKLEKLIK